jgi:hypothetical protein
VEATAQMASDSIWPEITLGEMEACTAAASMSAVAENDAVGSAPAEHPLAPAGLLQPNGCQPVGSSSAQGLDSSMPELVQFSGGGGVSVLCYSLA